MLLAGGQGSRLMPLTRKTAKPSVPFGAKYRIIDFPLSNCQNSGIDTVGVLTQYRPQELSDYLGQGGPWDMDLKTGGLHILSPYEKESGAEWFSGTADAIGQNIDFIRKFNPAYVLILSGDHIYKMNYDEMLQQHIRNHADCTIAVIEVPMEEASRFGIMNTDPKTDRILEFEEKPEHPKNNLASMGVYIFSADKLIYYLTKDKADPDSFHDFGKNIIPEMLKENQRMFAFQFHGYWRDVGTLSSYWASNMDVIRMDDDDGAKLELNDPSWRIYYRHRFTHPQYIGDEGSLTDSVVGDGCEINGFVTHSVLFSDIVIEEGAVVRDSVILSSARIHKGAVLDHVILDEGAEVMENTVLGAPDGLFVEGAKPAGEADGVPLTVAADHVKIGPDIRVRGGSVLTEDLTGDTLKGGRK